MIGRRNVTTVGLGTRRAGAVLDVLRTPDLRRLQIGWAVYFLVDAMTLVALSVWAFREGGTAAVGVLGLVRLLPGALALPFGAWAADQFSRRRVVTLVFAAMALTQAGLAVTLAVDAPRAIVYVLVAIASVVAAPYRPAHLALAPLVARTPEELVALNVTAGTLEGLVTFAGPAAAALLLLAAGPWLTVGVSAGAAALGATQVARISVGADPALATRRTSERPLEAILGGFAELNANRDTAVIIGCFVTQLLVRGVLGVLIVAVSFELVDLDSSGVGWLAAAMGIGGIVGALLASALTGRRRLGGPFAAGLVLWGGPIALIGIAPYAPVAMLALLLVGFGNSLLDVAGFSLVQRLGLDRALARVFGVLFTVGVAISGLGALAAPAIIDLFGVRPVLVGTGLVLPLLALVLLPRFRSIDSRAEPPSDVLASLVAVPLLAPLPPTMLEKLARRTHADDVAAGTTVVREGETGDRFYVIASGDVEVSQDGTPRRTLHEGDSFGEIALLRDVPRTATVVTSTPVRLLAIDGRDFVDALTSSPAAFTSGSGIADELLASDATARAAGA